MSGFRSGHLQVRITDKLSSETANVGDVFHGSLAAPVVANGRILFPNGAIVTGEVVNMERSGRLSTPGELHLNLRTIRTGGRTYPVSVQTVVIKGGSHTKSNVTKIGAGTAFGALIGAIAEAAKERPSVPGLEPRPGQEWLLALAGSLRKCNRKWSWRS